MEETIEEDNEEDNLGDSDVEKAESHEHCWGNLISSRLYTPYVRKLRRAFLPARTDCRKDIEGYNDIVAHVWYYEAAICLDRAASFYTSIVGL